MYRKVRKKRGSGEKRIKGSGQVKSLGFMLVLVLVFTLGVALYVNREAGSTPQGTRYFDEVTVHPGDTLWDLAGPYRPQGMDIRSFVALVAEINGVEDGIIHPGQRIVLPRK